MGEERGGVGRRTRGDEEAGEPGQTSQPQGYVLGEGGGQHYLVKRQQHFTFVFPSSLKAELSLSSNYPSF